MFLGYTNHLGALDTAGMLFVSGLSWAHVVRGCAGSFAIDLAQLWDAPELDALE